MVFCFCLGEVLGKIQKIGFWYGFWVVNVFHVGDGNLYFLIFYDGRQFGSYERVEQCAVDIFWFCIELGGSIIGEHGVGLEKMNFLKEMYGVEDIDFMYCIWDSVDLARFVNCGKMLVSVEVLVLFYHGLYLLEKQGIIFRN